MNTNLKLAVAFGYVLGTMPTLGQIGCPRGVRIEANVIDQTGATIPGAQVSASNGEKGSTDAAGRYVFQCAPSGSVVLTVQAQGFQSITVNVATRHGQIGHANIRMAVAAVETEVQVGDNSDGVNSDRGAGTTTLGTKEVEQLPDDPTDLLRELQTLAASAGGDPAATQVVVDGFQNGSAVPPKSSIASIRINPDIFAPEYQSPLWNGGRLEITTKAGADRFHGALYLTDSDGRFNATDPFSVTATPAGKRRYGFELSGPLVSKKTDFAIALEKRDIDEFNVVNATNLKPSGIPTQLQQTVDAPQRLWIASARGDWQITPKDTVTLSFSANVNNLGNQGVGGLTLAEAGYNSLQSEYDLRFSNAFIASANVLNQTRVGFSWKRTQQSPFSSAPSVQVSGYFTGGGATSQNLKDRERDLEIDDDLLISHGRHSLKVGIQTLGLFVHDLAPNIFNGAFIFGGGSAPALDANNNPTGQTENIKPIEQYRRALLGLPGGSPTSYQVNTGSPLVPFTQYWLGLYAQDTIKLAPRLSLDAGLRYQILTNPSSFFNLVPRVGISWSPDKKSKWVLHSRAGLFSEPKDLTAITAVERLNGLRQQQTTVYSPSFTQPLTPVPGSIDVSTVNRFANSYGLGINLQLSEVVEYDFPQHWHATTSYNFGGNWQSPRAVNINAPLVAASSGVAPDPIAALLAPRPIEPNKNIVEYQRSGHSRGDFWLASLDQHSYKHFGLHIQYWYLHFKESPLVPQSSYSELGESAPPDWMRRSGVSMLGTATLPYKIALSTQFTAMPGKPFNITTGTDANGDGNFNDRPSYAAANGIATRYGLLTSATVNGNVPYNAGTMPGVMYLDANVNRAFVLNPNDKDHLRTLTFNARSANLLNHTNVNSVNTILTSPAVGQPVSAETARRVELGVRFSF